jgi:tetratricopeptide (TPR) repeat protein
LASHGKRALESKDLTLAKRILPLAQSLSNTVETRALYTQLQETLQEDEQRVLNERRRTAQAPPAPRFTRAEPSAKSEPPPKSEQPPRDDRTAVQPPEQNGAKRLMDEFRKACQEKNLTEAQGLKSQLEQQGVNSQEFETLRKQLAGDVAKHVKQLIEIGATHYSQQRYQEAKDVWKEAHALDPKNEQLTARLKRVARVLDKLQTLRSKSPATP